jgi:uncharacterized damage-inducible protein DinB
MDDSFMDVIAGYCRKVNENILKVVDNLDKQQLAWRPNDTTPSLEFHVWHLARWADYLIEIIDNDFEQIWEKDGLADQWGFSEANLGFTETGMGMDENVLASLPFPDKDILFDYARRVLAKTDQAISSMLDDHFFHIHQDRYRDGWEYTLGQAVLEYLDHANRHLGMIECMLGVQGLQGSADY